MKLLTTIIIFAGLTTANLSYADHNTGSSSRVEMRYEQEFGNKHRENSYRRDGQHQRSYRHNQRHHGEFRRDKKHRHSHYYAHHEPRFNRHERYCGHYSHRRHYNRVALRIGL